MKGGLGSISIVCDKTERYYMFHVSSLIHQAAMVNTTTVQRYIGVCSPKTHLL